MTGPAFSDIPAQPGYQARLRNVYQPGNSYPWHPVVAWRVYAGSGAEYGAPIVISKDGVFMLNRYGPDEYEFRLPGQRDDE